MDVITHGVALERVVWCTDARRCTPSLCVARGLREHNEDLFVQQVFKTNHTLHTTADKKDRRERRVGGRWGRGPSSQLNWKFKHCFSHADGDTNDCDTRVQRSPTLLQFSKFSEEQQVAVPEVTDRGRQIASCPG